MPEKILIEIDETPNHVSITIRLNGTIYNSEAVDKRELGMAPFAFAKFLMKHLDNAILGVVNKLIKGGD